MYSLYSLLMFPQCLSVASEASLGTGKFSMELITSHDKKDCDGITNALKNVFFWEQNELFMLFLLILGKFWCSVITSVTFSSELCNFKKI